MALMSSWGRLFELAAAWCSFKIILASLGLLLCIESLGTILSRLKYKHLATAVFFLQIVSCAGVLVGGYCLVKAPL